VAAKRSPGRRFHALFDRIWRSDVLWEAWKRVQRNKGAAGVDRQTLAAVEEHGVACLLGELQRDLRGGRYRPAPVRRVAIPKPQGGVRPLGIPTVRDRVVQQAARIVLEPIFEAGFLDASHGFRPRRSATQAKEVARRSFIDGHHFVFEADIRDYFGSIDHDRSCVSGWLRRKCSPSLRRFSEANSMRTPLGGHARGAHEAPVLHPIVSAREARRSEPDTHHSACGDVASEA